jgi:hypothetical protein
MDPKDIGEDYAIFTREGRYEPSADGSTMELVVPRSRF